MTLVRALVNLANIIIPMSIVPYMAYFIYCIGQMVKRIREYLKSLPSLVEIDVPSGQKFTICGDIHGQFYDLVSMFLLLCYVISAYV